MIRRERNFAISRSLFPALRGGKGVLALGLVLLLTVLDPSFVSAQNAQDSSNRAPAATSAQQTNKPESAGKTAHKSGKLKWILIAGGAAAVAVAVVAAKRSTTPPTPQVTLGTPTVGQP